MSMFAALLIITAAFAIGEIVGTLTKAKISSMFVVMLVFLVLFLSNAIPGDIFTIAGLAPIGQMCMLFLLANMGSSVDIAQLKREWRTVATACIGLVAAIVSCIILIPVIGLQTALVAAPVINGGVVATNIMVNATQESFPLAAALATFMFAIQKFFGTPPASRYGMKFAQGIVTDLRAKKAADPTYSFYAAAKKEQGEVGRKKFCDRYTKYFSTFSCLCIGALIIWVATLLNTLTKGVIGMPLLTMFLAICVRNLGLIPANFLRDNAKANGFFLFGSFSSIIPAIGKIELSQIAQIGFNAIVCFAVSILAIILVFRFTPAYKLVGSRDLAIGISMCQMIGYPGTELITHEIAGAVGETQEEQDAILAQLNTAYVIAGFATVTLLSVVIANFAVMWL